MTRAGRTTRNVAEQQSGRKHRASSGRPWLRLPAQRNHIKERQLGNTERDSHSSDNSDDRGGGQTMTDCDRQ